MNTLDRRLLHLALWSLYLGAVVPAARTARARVDTISFAMRQKAAASRHINDATAVVRKLADVVVWSDTRGLFGDLATVEVNDIRFRQKMNWLMITGRSRPPM